MPSQCRLQRSIKVHRRRTSVHCDQRVEGHEQIQQEKFSPLLIYHWFYVGSVPSTVLEKRFIDDRIAFATFMCHLRLLLSTFFWSCPELCQPRAPCFSFARCLLSTGLLCCGVGVPRSLFTHVVLGKHLSENPRSILNQHGNKYSTL